MSRLFYAGGLTAANYAIVTKGFRIIYNGSLSGSAGSPLNQVGGNYRHDFIRPPFSSAVGQFKRAISSSNWVPMPVGNEGGGGTQSYSYTMVGGSLVGGLANFLRIRPFTMIGGGLGGGTSPYEWIPNSQLYSYTMVGGGIVGGMVLFSRTRQFSMTGGAIVGGTSIWSRMRTYIGTGGAVVGGGGLFQKINNFLMAAGGIVGGTAPFQRVYIGGVTVKGVFVNIFRRRRRV